MPDLRHVSAVRYVSPFREGGSLPGLVEADDDGMYVVKFAGAGQGVKALVAEVIVGELARALGLRVPELVTIHLPPPIARYEADEEVQDLLNASPGTNLGIDYLPGALGYDGSRPAAPAEADAILWLDALTANVDRTWDNPNLLLWHRKTWLIDHGASLYFHHGWPTRAPNPERFASQPFDAGRHVLRELATGLPARHEEFAQLLDAASLQRIIALVPGAWLEPTLALTTPNALRAAYVEHLRARLIASQAWLPGFADQSTGGW
ncbi:MAG: aminotransferase class I and II [Micrococcales bacterium]|nr:aminotransferase class I and II [Micrococcales bacterium]